MRHTLLGIIECVLFPYPVREWLREWTAVFAEFCSITHQYLFKKD